MVPAEPSTVQPLSPTGLPASGSSSVPDCTPARSSCATDIGGIAVHVAARVLVTAQSEEILACRTVRDLWWDPTSACMTTGAPH
jgi:class 3 adenylate cyclase